MTEAAFLEAILAAPDDDSPRLIFADWLDEQGEGDRAEFIRLQIYVRGLAAGDPQRAALEARINELRGPHLVDWIRRLPQADGVHWEVFDRGFISAVRFDHPDALFANAERVFAAAPIEELRLHQFQPPDAVRLARLPDLRRIRILDLNDGNRIGNAGVEALMASPYLSGLRVLRLCRNGLGPAAARAIGRAEASRGLVELRLDRNDLYSDAAGFLAESPALARLERLDLDHTRAGDEGVTALASAPHLLNLRLLNLSNNQISSRGAAALAASPILAQVTALFLQSNALRDGGVEALARSRYLGQLEYLFLRENGITDAGAVALATSPSLVRLRALYVGGNAISALGSQRLRERFGSGVNVY